MIYGIFFVDESPIRKNFIKDKNQMNFILDFFQTKHVVETFRTTFKHGKHQRRLRVILIMVALMITMGCLYGQMAVLYLFTRLQFNWAEVEYSLFTAFTLIVSVLGTSICLFLFSKKLHFHDSLVGVISTTSQMLGNFVSAFATRGWHIYAGSFVEAFGGTTGIALRSLATKFVEADEVVCVRKHQKVHSF